MAHSHVAPASLGAAYVVFFIYAGLVGVLAMILASVVASQQPKTAVESAAA
jgi:FtsH-binding integral membrane protein